ncbi:uncharacterized protein LOC134261307, partial [Saccostrea cucullata]|uniref:uncharacterized protein LOC134261307 n=1 Tax=Saccostrea cuccullata TaxID=36930 RepID=UPI002ED39710
MYILEELLSDMNRLFNDPVINVSVGFWIGGFVRASDKKILTPDCKSLNLLSAIDISKTEFTKEIVCLYYDRTAMKIHTDNCQKTIPFICESIDKGPASCLETSERTSLKERIPQMLCPSVTYPSLRRTQCETACIKTQRCYTVVIDLNDDCRIYRYEDNDNCDMGRNPPTYLQHI